MNCLNVNSFGNTVSFCENSLNPEVMNQLIKQDNKIGLSKPTLETELQNGDYNNVLVAVWTERDRSRRLSWLQSKSNELHAVLMFELAVAQFVATPNADTLCFYSIPLLEAAAFRVRQDATCSSDISVNNGDAAPRMLQTYRERLYKQVKKILKSSIQEIFKIHTDAIQTAIHKKIQEVAQQSLENNKLPSPDWIGWHGMSVFSTGQPSMYKADQYPAKRDAYARKVLYDFQLISGQ